MIWFDDKGNVVHIEGSLLDSKLIVKEIAIIEITITKEIKIIFL